MTAAPRNTSPGEVATGIVLARRTCCSVGEAAALREETGKSTEEAPRGRGPSTYARITKLMSGRANSQQGLTITCKDPSYKEIENGGRVLVWRVSP